MYNKICNECGTKYETDQKKQKYCSTDCRDESQRVKHISKTCPTCGNKFSGLPCYVKNKTYCSSECYHKSKKYNCKCKICGNNFKADSHNAKYCDKCRTFKCKVCGEEFKANPSEKQKYCCRECYDIAQKGREPWNKTNEYKICEWCGDEFKVIPSRKSWRKFCSRKCLSDFLSSRTGKDNPLWQGGRNKYIKERALAEGSWYRNRRKTLIRDNKTCQLCGYDKKDRYFDVHHILPVIEGGNNKLNNLVTLCRKCHNKLEHLSLNEQLNLLNYKNNVQMALF